jgi:hypothetical protein
MWWKYDGARRATDCSTVFCAFACWITKATDAQSEYDYLLLFNGNGESRLCVMFIRTLPDGKVYILGLLEKEYRRLYWNFR